MIVETWIGIGASVFTGVALLPQFIKVYKEKTVEGVSFLMLVSLFAGLGLWITYGCLKKDLIIIISNGFSLLVNLGIFSLALLYKR